MGNNNWHLEETYKSLIQISTVVMRFILIANGGAAIALLAFAGNLYANKIGVPPSFKPAMLCFLGGVTAGGFTCIFSYLTQLTLYREERDKLGTSKHHKTLYTAMFFAVLGVLLFGIGSWVGISQL